ncbi:efflux RND transporter periplasmic adaptor subunit [Pseudomonas frederiksbergensis]|nr:efflux RND transporter periplasmic adaptor subunit [Pseudomonas frederiksbergensis]
MITGCNDDIPPPITEPPARPAIIVTVGSDTAGSKLRFPGVVRAARRAELSFDVAGKLVEFKTETGARVAQGHVIARLDDTLFASRVRAAEAEFKRAQTDYQRHFQLWERQQLARTLVDDRQATLEVMRSRLATAREELANTSLRAPFDGILVRRHIETFGNVQAKQPIAELQNLEQLEIVIHVPERLLRSQPRQTRALAVFEGHEQPVQLNLNGYSAEAHPQTQTYEVILSLEPGTASFPILPGMSASVQPFVQTHEDGLPAVPLSAISAGADGAPHVWIVAEDGRVTRRAVVTGDVSGEMIAVPSGLNVGERIVSVGIASLREGMRVRPLENAEHDE